jgi:hypothetical protein
MASRLTSVLLDKFAKFKLSTSPVIKPLLTLRNCCEDYRNANGFKYMEADYPDLSCASSKDQACSLKLFKTIPGVVCKGTMLCFPVTAHDSVSSMLDAVTHDLGVCVRSGRLWCTLLHNSYYKERDTWKVNGADLEVDECEVLDRLPDREEPPLAAYSVHAYAEAQSVMDRRSIALAMEEA